MKTLKASIPWLVSMFAGSWLRDRAFHVPEADVNGLAWVAGSRAIEEATAAGRQTPNPVDWWRSVEETQAQYVTAGVVVRAEKL